MIRRAAIVLLALATGVVAVVLVLHAPFVRTRVLRYALATVQEQYGIRVEAERLDYNLAALRAGLAGVRLTAVAQEPRRGSGEEPFFQAEYLSATLSSSALFGNVAFENVSVTNGRLLVVRYRDGTTNLPPSVERGSGEPPPLRIALIDIPRLRIDVRDEQGDAALALPSVEIRLTRDAGRIALLAPADLRAGERSTRVTQLEADATFDGRTLALRNAQLRSAEAAARFYGTMTLIAEHPALDLTINGTGDVAAIARWAIAEGDIPTGTVALEGKVSGPMAAPDAQMRLTSRRVVYQDVVLTDIAANAHVTSVAARVEDLAFGFEGGRITGAVSVPFDDSDARLQISWAGLEAGRVVKVLAPAVEIVPAAVSVGELSASGPAAATNLWRADLRARLVAGRNAPSRIAVGGDAHLVLDRGSWRLDGTHRIAGTMPATIALRGRLLPSREADSTVAGSIRVAETALLPLFDVLRVTGVADPPAGLVSSGSVNGELHVSGRVSDARVAFNATAEDLSVQDAGASGRLTAVGTYALNSQRYTAEIDASDWQLMATADQPLSGRLDIHFMGAGTVEAPGGEATLALRAAQWEDVSLGDVSGNVTLDGRSAVIEARAPRLSATASGRVGLDAPYVAAADVRADRLNLRVLPWLADLGEGMPAVQGATTVSAHIEGPLESWRSLSATAEIASLEATAGELPVRLVEPARLAYLDNRVRLERLEATAGDTRLSASGELPLSEVSGDTSESAVLVTVTGDVGEMARAAAAAGITELPLAGGRGPVALLARVTGSVETPVVAADLEAGPGTVTVEGFAPVSDVRLRAHAGSGWLELREANASYQGATMSATGRAPLSLFTGEPAPPGGGGVELSARATGITPRVLEPMVDPATLEDVTGTIDATADLASPTLNLDDVTGEIRLDRLELTAADLPVTQTRPTRVSIRDGFARIEAWDWKGQGATLGLRGQVRLTDRQLAILADGTVDLRMLTPFVRDAGVAVAGTMAPRLSITGAAADPRIDGDVTVSGGEMRLAEPRVVLSDLTARAVLTNKTATISALGGTINGGPLTGDGEVSYDPAEGVNARLSANVLGVALEFPPGLRSEVNADLTLALAQRPDEETPTGLISGTVTVARGFYREPLAVVTGLLTTLRTRRLAAAAEPSPLLDGLQLDVRLITDEDILVDNNYGRLQLGGDLRVIGTASAPALSGRAEIREGGQLFVGRNVYTVTFGTIDFANPVTIVPDLDVQATTRVANEDIEVTIRGTPETISVDLRSTTNPDLGQAEVASLLLTGRRFEDLDPGDAAFVGTQVLGNFSAEVLGFAGRAVGLDTLRLGGVEGAAVRRDPFAVAGEVDPTTRVTFGKTVGSDVELTFSQSLRDSTAQTWIVDYLPARRVEFHFVSNDDDLRSYGFRHDMTFGGAGPRLIQSAGASQRARERRVGSVNLTGELAVPEMRIRGLLRLTTGRRFDFGEWQADRDRVEAFYRQAGYLAARVSATRAEIDDAVRLVYAVVPGPKTSIAVSGIELDAASRARLERTWTDAVFDEFLVDEATAVVREAVADHGYLQAMVAVRVEGDAADKRLVIDVEQGPRTTRTVIDVRMPGPPAVEPGLSTPGAPTIDAFIASRGLVDRAATDPETLEREVTAYLRSLGHLGAKVTAGAPRFEDATAIVPLSVDPGPLLTIGRVTIAPTTLPIETVREAAAITEGMPFDPALLDAARDRLVALYRREAFSSPSVTVGQDVRQNDFAIDVAIAIDEGARQLLGEVAVSGNRAIDSDVIVRALGLTLDEPLRAEESLRARTRVFDTGLFRRVDVSSEPMDQSGAGVTRMRLRVNVEEWPALRVRYGVQVAEERPEGRLEGRDLVPGLRVDLTRRTIFGRAVGVGGAVDVQRREQRARGFLNAPTLAGWPVESSLVFERSRETFAAATLVTNAQGVSWEQRTRVARDLSLSYSYRFERNHTFDTAPPTPGLPSFDITINIARLNTAVAWDTRDDPTNATRGTFASSSIEYAPEALGSDIRFVRFVNQAYSFHRWRDVVFASAARVGAAAALGDQDLIFSERFFAGGAGTVRGVAENSLGTVDFFGDPTGGQVSLVFNQEVRVPIYRWVRGVGFIDAGNVFPRWRDVRIGSLVGSVGVGLRLNTPFALLRADYARAIWTGTPTPSGRFIVGIGQAF